MIWVSRAPPPAIVVVVAGTVVDVVPGNVVVWLALEVLPVDVVPDVVPACVLVDDEVPYVPLADVPVPGVVVVPGEVADDEPLMVPPLALPFSGGVVGTVVVVVELPVVELFNVPADVPGLDEFVVAPVEPVPAGVDGVVAVGPPGIDADDEGEETEPVAPDMVLEDGVVADWVEDVPGV